MVLNPTSLSFGFGSSTTGTNPGSGTTVFEGWQIYGSNTLGILGSAIAGWSCTATASTNCNGVFNETVSGSLFKYYGIGSLNGDVLLNEFNIVAASITTFAETPIPGAAFLFASGLAGFGMLGWRRRKKVSPVTVAA